MLDLVRQVAWTPEGEQPYTKLPASDLVVFELEGGHRAMVRPSGTEPKLKHYFYTIGSPGPAESMDAAQSRAREILDRMSDALTGASGC
jgi:phosphomannomutase